MFGAFDIDSLDFETRCLIRRVQALTGESERDAVHRAMDERYQRLTGADAPAERRQQLLGMLESIWAISPERRRAEPSVERPYESCAHRQDSRTSLDARGLCLIARREPGYETVIDAVASDESPRICATALVEAAIRLREGGDNTAEQTVQLLIGALNLAILPFTADHWKEAARALSRA
jgi:hypothetical protein